MSVAVVPVGAQHAAPLLRPYSAPLLGLTRIRAGVYGCARNMRTRSEVTIEVLAYAPAAFFHCMHCELIWQQSGVRTKDRREQLETSLPEDLKQQYQQLSDWVRGIQETYGSRVRFRVIDAASVEGCLKSLWYGVRRFPAVIVDGKERSIGMGFEHATALVERRLAAVPKERGLE